MFAVDSFWDGIKIAFEVIGQMGLIVLLGFILVKRKWIGQTTLDHLTRILVDIVVPCVFIVSLSRGFDAELVRNGLTIITVVFIWTIGSDGLCTVLFKLKPYHAPSEDRAVTAMTMVQNGIYLPLPVMLAMTPASAHDQVTVYIGMAILPSMIVNWTLGVDLLSGGPSLTMRERIRLVLNPPVLAMAAGFILAQIPGISEAARSEPSSFLVLRMIFSAMDFVGRLLSPLAMILLGAFIASSTISGRIKLRHLSPLILIRLIAVPAAVFFVLKLGWIHLPAMATILLVIESASPPATNHSIIARRYNGEWELVSSLQLFAHAAALITLPIWLALGLHLYGR